MIFAAHARPAWASFGCPDEVNDLILGHAKRGVLAHYDHSKRIPERAEWLHRWAEHVAECVGLSAPMKAASANPVLHLYATPAGLPEIKASKEPASGRRYLGAFTPIEASRKVAEMARDLSVTAKRARGR